jgi:hypothetical protein
MRISLSNHLGVGLLLPLLVAGCAGGSSATLPEDATAGSPQSILTAPSRVNPLRTAKSPFLYVSNTAVKAAVLLYRFPIGKHAKPEREITQGLQGVPADPVLDRNGTLYQPSGCSYSGEGGIVGVYPAGQSSPSETITNGINCPLGSAIDAHGNLYISNTHCEGSYDCQGTITEYPPDQTSPSLSISANLQAPHGLALDAHNDLFIADPYVGAVLEVKKGHKTPAILSLSGVSFPIQVATDHVNNLYVSDYAANEVLVYAPGATTPEASISNPNPGTLTYGLCLKEQGALFVVDLQDNGSPSIIEEYKNPLQSSSPVKSITNGLSNPDGCAAKEF